MIDYVYVYPYFCVIVLVISNILLHYKSAEMTFTRLMTAMLILAVPHLIVILLAITPPYVYSTSTYDIVQTDKKYLTKGDSDSLWKYSLYVKGKSDRKIRKLRILKEAPCTIVKDTNRAEIIERVYRVNLGILYADLPDYRIYLPLKND